MTQPTVRLGYIGAGAYSRRVLLPNFKKIPGVELVAVANSSPQTSGAVAKEFGFARTAADWREVVDADDIDAIVIGTRTEAHFEMIPPVLEAGRHVLSMNALCRNAAQARELTAKATEHPHQVALVYPAGGAGSPMGRPSRYSRRARPRGRRHVAGGIHARTVCRVDQLP